ncbi:6463_t:CDS:2 [Funneliformis mosseae]|uniref:6463_t:CDS:1 n=1 Tax=Funneliformis mosseae TaxID=27381 RepID=A0A9N9D5T1_FUNMO|nr:6463_t:CDS:2 [Funneliformis mosseae]
MTSITSVIEDTENPNSPRFLCYSEENRSGVCSSPTEQLLSYVIFRLYMFSFEKLNIFMLGMRKLKKSE